MVIRRLLIVSPVFPLLAACTLVAEKAAEIVCTLALAGVTVVLQLQIPLVTVAARTQAPPKASLPTDDRSATVPVGNDLVPDAVSVTVTVTVLAWATTTVLALKKPLSWCYARQ